MSVTVCSKPRLEDYEEALKRGDVSGLSGLERVETHMSRVFLGAEHVYKIVRAVRHPFADMRSLARRKGACEAEFAINKAIAPALYEGVVQIVQTPGGDYRLGGDGTVVDYAVLMNRFPSGATFAELSAKGRLTAGMIDAAVDALALYHRRQPAKRDPKTSRGFVDVIADLHATASQGAPPPPLAQVSDTLFASLASMHRRLEPTIEARRAGGFVKRGHGDFHLKNLCIYRGEVMPFDALAFDENLATTDTLYDLAFLLMDLRLRRDEAFASRAMNRYFDRLDQDERSLGLLPFFMALRASVRMAVAIEGRAFEEAFRYARLAARLLEPAPVRLVAIGGLSGTGKSVVARGICHLLPGPAGARILNTDVIRKSMAGVDSQDPMPSRAYREDARRTIYATLAQRAPTALDAGTSVIADGTYTDPGVRRDIASAAGGRPFCGIWLQAETAHRLARITSRRHDVSDATVEIAARQAEPACLGQGWQKVDANGEAPHTIELVSKLLKDSELAG